MKSLEVFDFSDVKLSSPNKVFGGATKSNGHKTKSSGADQDDATSDEDFPDKETFDNP